MITEAVLVALLGGALIGLAAVILMKSLGRVMGVSGILWGAIFAGEGDKQWRWLFLLGVMLGSLLFHLVTLTPIPDVEGHWVLAIIGGLLVGIGVKLGNGCTSGHGVCGIARFSIRSLVATLTFIFTGILTVSLFK